MKDFLKKLSELQAELKAPKNQYNKFANFPYRNQEDILEAVKPLLKKYGLNLTISDEVLSMGETYFIIDIKTQEIGGKISILMIKSTVTLSDGENSVSSSSFAGINPNKKGMDIAQSFGSSSSYARKYALNGLFLIDDTKDADCSIENDNHSHKRVAANSTKNPAKAITQTTEKPRLPTPAELEKMIEFVSKGKADIVEQRFSKYLLSDQMKNEILSTPKKAA